MRVIAGRRDAGCSRVTTDHTQTRKPSLSVSATRPSVEIRGVRVAYGSVGALSGVSLEVQPGEFLSILGPSGCGKTTLLNVIAGFIAPQEGQVLIGGRDVTRLPPNERSLSMVFQNYALFPHMTTWDNVAYGLKVRHTSRSELRKRVGEALSLVGLTALADRRPRQLSGGQQQRIAVARALAVNPLVLLMDEPLSNLDAKLRREMRLELKALQERTGTTTIFVTHDQEEALVMSDRIAVMSHGSIEQVAIPVQLYSAPATRYVADFVGQANLLEGHTNAARSSGSGWSFDWSGRTVAVDGPQPEQGSAFLAVIRPEQLTVSLRPVGGDNCFSGTIRYAAFMGNAWQYGVDLDGNATLVALMRPVSGRIPQVGEQVWVSWAAKDIVIVPDKR